MGTLQYRIGIVCWWVWYVGFIGPAVYLMFGEAMGLAPLPAPVWLKEHRDWAWLYGSLCGMAYAAILIFLSRYFKEYLRRRLNKKEPFASLLRQPPSA